MTTYGGISDVELEEGETELKEEIFDATKHMVEVYNAVEDLQELAAASVSRFSDSQEVSLGVKLIKSMRELKRARRKWIEKDKKDQT